MKASVLFVLAVALVAPATGQTARDSGNVVESLGNGDWMMKMPSSVRQRMEEHLEVFGSIRSRPQMTNSVLGVNFEPTRTLPLAVFEDVLDGSKEAPTVAMMGAFNVQLISPDHAIELPQEAVLRTSLTHSGRRGYIEVDMELREDAYFIKYPAHVLSDNTNAASALLDASGGQFVIPAMEVHDLSGFTFNESTVENLLPLGVPVTINLRYGDVRVDTMFQWVGRPPSIPFNDGVDFLR